MHFALIQCKRFVLLMAIAAVSAQATIITTTEILRADFDLSGLVPPGPYDFLRTEFYFNSQLQPNQGISVTVFNKAGVALSAENTVVNNFGTPISNVGFENSLIPPSLANGAGFALIHFSQDIDVDRLDVAGAILPVPLTTTSRVPARLTVITTVPEPGTFLAMSAAIAALIITRKSKCMA